MKRTIAIAAAISAVTIATIVAYDRGRSGAAPVRTASSGVAIGAQSSLYRVETSAATVLKLGASRRGCTLTAKAPPTAICDVATAFPDAGLNGTITFVGTARHG
jgi:hypothetical protein